MARRRRAVFIARPTAARAAAHACLRLARPAGCRARSAAGVTWTSRTASAPWAARYGHTTVVDANGAIYVIGGSIGYPTFYHDVWVSTDGGARAGLRQRGGGSKRGYWVGAQSAYSGYHRVLSGTKW